MSAPSDDWTSKAEADYHAARVLLRQRTLSLYDQVCFLSQQSAEKYLKSFLVASQVEFPKIHKLLQINDLCMAVDAEFDALRSQLTRLETYAVDVRYPGTAATKEDAKAALAVAQEVRQFVRQKLDALAGDRLA